MLSQNAPSVLFSKVSPFLLSWAIGGLGGKFKNYVYVRFMIPKARNPLLCTVLCYSTFAFGIDQPGLINLGFYGSSMKSNTFLNSILFRLISPLFVASRFF